MTETDPLIAETDSHSSVSDLGISGDDVGVDLGVVRQDDPRYEVADELRLINTLLVATPEDDAALYAAVEGLGRIRANLEASAGPGRRPRVHPDARGPAQDYFPTSPIFGMANPIAPPVKIENMPDGSLEGRVTFDYQYEGPPGCVHGGIIALTFDEMLGAANITARSPGMTGTLTIRYRRPTPIRTELRMVGRFKNREGRKIFAWGGLYNGEELTAEAEGIFIELTADRFFANMAAQADSK
ncbi:MAG: PaaI family thioesterase [Acidimicrobiales bacterium]|jgi:acyl-coenzyme A thioesterase PaaI-like protein